MVGRARALTWAAGGFHAQPLQRGFPRGANSTLAPLSRLRERGWGEGRHQQRQHHTTPEGGSVYLIAPQVENNGIINTLKGETILAAGNTVQLIDTGTPGVTVQVTGSNNTRPTLARYSQTLAHRMVGAVVKNSGWSTRTASSAKAAKIFLRATKNIEAGGTINAQGVGGGEIKILADMQNGTTNVTGH